MPPFCPPLCLRGESRMGFVVGKAWSAWRGRGERQDLTDLSFDRTLRVRGSVGCAAIFLPPSLTLPPPSVEEGDPNAEAGGVVRMMMGCDHRGAASCATTVGWAVFRPHPGGCGLVAFGWRGRGSGFCCAAIFLPPSLALPPPSVEEGDPNPGTGDLEGALVLSFGIVVFRLHPEGAG